MLSSGLGDWKEGLKMRCPSRTDWRQIKAIHHYLSGKGIHGCHDPNNTEAEYCLKVTIATIEVLIEKVK